MIGDYAIRHTDAAGTVHTWTCPATSAHGVACWHARDSGRDTAVLRRDWDGWRQVTVWSATGGCDPPPPAWSDVDDYMDDDMEGWEPWPDDEPDTRPEITVEVPWTG